MQKVKEKKIIISHCRCSNIVCVLINVYLTSVKIARKHNNIMQPNRLFIQVNNSISIRLPLKMRLKCFYFFVHSILLLCLIPHLYDRS